MDEEITLLEVRHLHKDYGNGAVLEDISLNLKKGEVLVLIGPSGCGKSTFLRCINGLEPIQSGEILLDGVSITDGTARWSEVRQKIGMVFQSYELFPHITVMDNILLGPMKVQKRNRKEAEADACQLLERVGLLDKKDAYPRQLSGGQKQRVAIVRALIMKPEIMLFDVMMELAGSGSTMMIVTHEMQFARAAADRVIFLDGGEIVETGTPDAFFDSPKTDRAQRFLNTFTFEKK